MSGEENDGLAYLNREDILTIHEDIIYEDEDAEPGILGDESEIDYVLEFIESGHFGYKPETIHEKAVELMRLLAANYIFVDGNKRTALNAVSTFYLDNGLFFDYGEEIRAVLNMFAVKENFVDKKELVKYMEDITKPFDSDEVIE